MLTLQFEREISMNTFQNLLGETLPSFRSQIVGIKEAKRGWRNIYQDRHSISPKNIHRNLCRTSPLHIRAGWGGNSVAQTKENMLSRPDTMCRSGCDVPKNGRRLTFNRWCREIFNAFQQQTLFEIQKCRTAFLNPQ